MWILIIALIIMRAKANKKNVFSGRQFKSQSKLITVLIVLSIAMCFSGPLFILTMVASPFFIPLILIYYAKASNKTNIEEGSYNQRNDRTGNYYGDNAPIPGYYGPNNPYALPQEATKRRTIVERFNNKYQLYLTDSQMQRIVDASYYSPDWQRELADMNKIYGSVFEWFKGPTSWLRAYLSAFQIQNVSSDFPQQRAIVLSEFSQIFDSVDLTNYYSLEEAINAINEKYFTLFNDVSFMVAYRFLQSNGKRYNLPQQNIISNESEVDKLLNKYRPTSQQ